MGSLHDEYVGLAVTKPQFDSIALYCFLWIDENFFPISQFTSFTFKSICFLFLLICSFQFSLQSKCSPRYFTDSVFGMMVWLMLTGGQWPFRTVNVMCVDLDSLTLIFHLRSHFSMLCKCSCRLIEAIVGSAWVANIAVSYVNVPKVVLLDVGKSEVYSVQRTGPRILPWRTPEWMRKRVDISLLNFVSKWRSFRQDFSRL